MRKLTSHIETAMSRIITATTGAMTLGRKLKRIEALMRSISVLGEIRDAHGEIQFDVPVFRHDHLFDLAGQALVPCLYFISASRDVKDRITATLIRGGEIRVFKNQYNTMHICVNGAEDINATWLIEGYFFHFRILVQPQVKRIGFRIGKDVV